MLKVQKEYLKRMKGISRQRFKELIEESGMSQKSVAEQIGVTKSTVNKWLKGTTYPNLIHLVKLAKLFNVTIDYIAGRDAKKHYQETK